MSAIQTQAQTKNKTRHKPVISGTQAAEARRLRD